jgi:hypothetical protein
MKRLQSGEQLSDQIRIYALKSYASCLTIGRFLFQSSGRMPELIGGRRHFTNVVSEFVSRT